MLTFQEHEKQLKTEINNSSDHKFFERFKNSTDTVFTEDETKLQEKGINYNLPE